jgi:LysM repeat protein
MHSNLRGAPSRLLWALTLVLAAGSLVVSSGCGKSKAAAANDPAPQTLSEPVRPMPAEVAPAATVTPIESTPPAIPVTSNQGEITEQKPGESRDLPQFVAPSTPQPPPTAPAVVVPLDKGSHNTKGGGRYHTLSKGETLTAVSRKYNVKLKDVIAANQFKDPNKLAVGTKVYLP